MQNENIRIVCRCGTIKKIFSRSYYHKENKRQVYEKLIVVKYPNEIVEKSVTDDTYYSSIERFKTGDKNICFREPVEGFWIDFVMDGWIICCIFDFILIIAFIEAKHEEIGSFIKRMWNKLPD